MRFLSDDERVELLSVCKESRSPYLHTVVVLALPTGMRLGEIMGLTWPGIDLKAGRITLTDTKNGETRAVPVVGTALDILRSHAKVRRIDTLLVFPTKPINQPAFFSTGDGRRTIPLSHYYTTAEDAQKALESLEERPSSACVWKYSTKGL